MQVKLSEKSIKVIEQQRAVMQDTGIPGELPPTVVANYIIENFLHERWKFAFNSEKKGVKK